MVVSEWTRVGLWECAGDLCSGLSLCVVLHRPPPLLPQSMVQALGLMDEADLHDVGRVTDQL